MKNRLIFTILASIILIPSLAFTQNKPTNKLIPIKTETGLKFKEIQKSIDDYWKGENVKNGYYIENGEKRKAPGWKLQKRWEYYWEKRVNQKTGEFPTTTSIDEYQKYLESQNSLYKANYSENWTNLGTNTSAGGYAGLGRINCITFHPTDVNTFWVGSPSGGIWKTTNGGTSWTILNNNETVIGVSDIIVDYTNTNVLYIATGDRDGGSMWSLSGGQGNDNNSIGVLKSTDGGNTWNTTGLSFSASQVTRITRLLIHPVNNSILFASVWTGSSSSSGIWKSTDGGANWIKKTSNLWIDMEFKPGDPTIMYASSYGYGSTLINRSTDSGENWSFSTVAASGRRGEIAVTPNDPTIVYLLAANSGGGVDGVYKSTNSGSSFSKVNANSATEPGMLGYYTDGRAPATGQGSYDWCIAVDPNDANTVFIGGITTWKSTDGGVNWTANNNWTSYFGYNLSGAPVVHADKHALVYQNSSSILFEGNDGGIYKTTNGGNNWTDLTNGIIISQIYRIGISQTDANVVLTGLQDNGSKKYIGGLNTWVDVTGGDGMECIVDFNNATSYMYATYVRGQIYRNSNGFSTTSTTTISANIPGGQPTGAWVTPYIMDPTNAAILYAGYDQVYKTTNRGNSWTSASQQLSAVTKLRSLAIAPSNTLVLYSADQTNLWKTTDGGATNWTSITLPGTPTSSITYIAVKNNDPNTVWITYGGYQAGEKVYQSTDGGTSWTNISTGLPNLPVMCIVQYKTATNRNVLFVGTDVGVYVKDGTNNWASYSNGLPNVVVTELEILYSGGTDKLRAGTYGRGLWETDIDAGLPVELVSFKGNTGYDNILLNWQTATELENYGFEIQRNSIGAKTVMDNWENVGFVNGHGTSSSPKEYSFSDSEITSGIKYFYRLKQIDNDGTSTYSKVIEVDAPLISSFSLDQNFPNPFNPATRIKFALPTESNVKLLITDLLGQEITVLVDKEMSAGNHEAVWNPDNVSSGIYFYTINISSLDKTESFSKTKKMIYLE
ncbi:MAG: T9SS type A sorting domain-containing protein [Ignavibacteriae bacterium]|jgi:photosystem II stability/assembly factor-like uncharacterized protein|nr:T9SS C-terminal target domain-containing protein [Ignavibacteriota bacterium]NOH00363.1 T9SS type A sorting domain-containing protein [Ignavibacteriota bacterium]